MGIWARGFEQWGDMFKCVFLVCVFSKCVFKSLICGGKLVRSIKRC